MEFLEWAIAVGIVRIVNGKVDIESIIEAYYKFNEGEGKDERTDEELL